MAEVLRNFPWAVHVASSDDIRRVRRMIGESGTALFLDADVSAAIRRYPLTDVRGEVAVVPGTTLWGKYQENPRWDPTWDLNAAAADLIEEKAAQVMGQFDFATDRQTFNRSQSYDQMLRAVRYFRARRSPYVIKLHPGPPNAGTQLWGDPDEELYYD